jgi:hypothetical protein
MEDLPPKEDSPFIQPFPKATKKAPQLTSSDTAQQLTSPIDSKEQFVSKYTQPKWGGWNQGNTRACKLSVLKNGTFIESIDLLDKGYFMIGNKII